jgi:hypothetical protein
VNILENIPPGRGQIWQMSFGGKNMKKRKKKRVKERIRRKDKR